MNSVTGEEVRLLNSKWDKEKVKSAILLNTDLKECFFQQLYLNWIQKSSGMDRYSQSVRNAECISDAEYGWMNYYDGDCLEKSLKERISEIKSIPLVMEQEKPVNQEKLKASRD